jgi:hypothetical protein
MKHARYQRQSSAYKHGPRMTFNERAIAHHILTVTGFVYCQRCKKGWLDTDIDAMERQTGVSAIWKGEAALALCPRCLLVERLLVVLRHRAMALQMEEERQLEVFPNEIRQTLK